LLNKAYKMRKVKTIKSALISVFHKDGLEPLVKELHKNNVTIYSTGGTEKFIKELSIPVTAVEDLTSYPSILGGRVKTLHPKVFGGILNRQDHDGDISEMSEYNIPQIDLVIVDLYPFEKTVSSGASEQDIVEKIDIGGISLIRASAKNFKDTFTISSMDQYEEFLQFIKLIMVLHLYLKERNLLQSPLIFLHITIPLYLIILMKMKLFLRQVK